MSRAFVMRGSGIPLSTSKTHAERKVRMSFNLSSTPFSSTSAWNQQVPTGATYTSLNWPTATGWNYDVGWGNVPVYVASSSDPVVQVSVPASWGWPGGTVSVHAPAGGTGGIGTDGPVVIIDGDIAYNFWQFHRTSTTTATAVAYGEANVVTGTGWGGSGKGAGITAAGSSELGGLLVQAQTDTGTINHALQLAVEGSLLKSGYVSPAIATDGSSSSGIMQEGQLLAIAPGTPMPSGLSTLGQEVFRALQQYGAYVIDDGGTQTAIRTQANAYDAATMDALRRDMNTMLPMLKAVSGGTPTTSPTTPTTPTAPVNVAPTVTQASASPGTGVEHVGDTVTMTLGFSEAVTVTGTPTLSLNDGAKATYVGGSGTNSLTFKTTVASTDTTTSALAITGVNLPSGASIKDTGGLAANLSGAVKTFTGLQVDPTSTTPTTPTSPTPPSTPSVISPVLTIADDSLWVAGRGGTVDLGTKVTTTDSNDRVALHITGLPKYESITDALDGQTFRGRDITLTAAQVNSGLTLTSTYRGGGHPVAELTLTASATDPSTGAVATAAPKTITVTDPRPARDATTTTSSHGHHAVTDQQPVATATAVTPTASQTIEPTDHQSAAAASTGFLASRAFALLQQHFDPAGSSLATTAAHPVMAADHPSATGSTMASLASQSFALLNQYLAAHTGRVDPGQIVAAVSQATGWGHDALLARPQH
ncbi:hypothetical protein N2603_28125 [Bradyrhizobium huanghuaihaiense]|uniref:hypothetical protein n=1 Tax=Bradyrhizobium huanghuaihaiense TaxID=990078 RepID=UPI0021AA2745|nr:hypothetical protein [Bradyrhizobium sp. CB3035]UWU73924.1 hypothetical protein N2603_28125 [Bradyrhizobium sp. CB3035]